MPSLSAKVISNLLLLSIFTTSITIIDEPLRIPLSYFLTALGGGYLILYRRSQLYEKRNLFLALVGLGIHSIVCILVGSVDVGALAPTFGLAVVSFLAFHLLLSKVPFHNYLVVWYVRLCFFVAVIGVFQYLSFLIGFDAGYDFSGFLTTVSPLKGAFGIRLASILSEPSHVAFCMGPALVLAVYALVNIRTPFITIAQASTIFLFAVLSGSTTVYVVLAIGCLSVPLVRKGRIFLIGSVVAALVLFYSAISSSDLFSSTVVRLSDLVELIQYGANAGAVNASSFTSYFNFKIAVKVFIESYGFGGGIGSHLSSSERIIGSTSSLVAQVYALSTAGGLFNRLISELGVFGIGALAVYVVVFFRRLRRLRDLHLVVHLCFGIGITSFLIRQGTYSQFGIAFYLLMFLTAPQLRLTRNR